METAIFAAGCFWGVQYYFDQVPGVVDTEVGYTGGHTENPTYEQVCMGNTGFAEAVKIEFDPKVIDYPTMLKQFFRMHDPTQLNRQGPDIGDQYRSAIFYLNDEQKDLADKMINQINDDSKSGRVVTSIEPADKWWRAEDYHQKFTERTGRGMCHIPYANI